MTMRIGVLLAIASSLGAAWLLPAATSQPTITLSVTSGPPGTPVTISGSGFPPDQVVAIYIDMPGPYLGFPGPKADAQGAFHVDIKWPGKNYDDTGHIDPARPGVHLLCGDTQLPNSRQAVPANACAQFTVQVVRSPSPSTSPAATPRATGLPIPVVFLVLALLAALLLALLLWMRHSQ